MKTTIDIPNELLNNVMKLNGSKTKKKAIIEALSDYVQRKRIDELCALLGTCENFMTQEDLKKMREDDKWEQIGKYHK